MTDRYKLAAQSLITEVKTEIQTQQQTEDALSHTIADYIASCLENKTYEKTGNTVVIKNITNETVLAAFTAIGDIPIISQEITRSRILRPNMTKTKIEMKLRTYFNVSRLAINNNEITMIVA